MVVAGKNSLEGRKLYLPHMDYHAARVFAAAFRSIGIDACPSPHSDAETLLLGKRYTSGEECYPEIVTFGDFMKVTHLEGFEPEKTAFFMPTAPGPCRFGQYSQFQRMVLDDLGLHDVMIVSPTSATGYEELGEHAQEFVRTGWRGLVAADILRKMLLKTRPYEVEKGTTDRVMHDCIGLVCDAVAVSGIDHARRLELMVEALEKGRDRFRAIDARYTKDKPLIGVVGEIFCRLNIYSNDDLIRKVEDQGGEAWLCNMHISPYEPGSRENVDPKRRRKLLLHRREINRLLGRTVERGLTIVPLRLYLQRGYAKVELGLARGRRQYDKRKAIAEREARREEERALSERQRGE